METEEREDSISLGLYITDSADWMIQSEEENQQEEACIKTNVFIREIWLLTIITMGYLIFRQTCTCSSVLLAKQKEPEEEIYKGKV